MKKVPFFRTRFVLLYRLSFVKTAGMITLNVIIPVVHEDHLTSVPLRSRLLQRIPVPWRIPRNFKFADTDGLGTIDLDIRAKKAHENPHRSDARTMRVVDLSRAVKLSHAPNGINAVEEITDSNAENRIAELSAIPAVNIDTESSEIKDKSNTNVALSEDILRTPDSDSQCETAMNFVLDRIAEVPRAYETASPFHHS